MGPINWLKGDPSYVEAFHQAVQEAGDALHPNAELLRQ
jgi:hypothetical protein